MIFRCRGLRHSPDAALLVGDGGVGCGAVCSSPGGRRVLLAARRGRCSAVGHEGVVRCDVLGERPTAICVWEACRVNGTARALNTRPNGCAKHSSHDPTMGPTH